MDIVELKKTLPYKLGCLLTVFPTLCLTIAVDRYLLTKRNPFIAIPRTTAEIRTPDGKRRFFALLQSGAVKRGGVNGTEPLVPADAVMVYMDVKKGASAEPEKDNYVAVVEVGFRRSANASKGQRPSSLASFGESEDDTAVRQMVESYARFTRVETVVDEATGAEIKDCEVTVLRLFVKMATARRWPIVFKALIASFCRDVKEGSVFNDLVPMMQDYLSGKWGTTVGSATAANEKAPRNGTNVGSDGLPMPPAFPRNLNCPIALPTCHYTTWSRVFDRTLTIFDCIDTTVWRPVADCKMVTEEHLITQVTSIARFHAVTVGRVGNFASRYHPEMLAMSPLGVDKRIHALVTKWSDTRDGADWLQALLDAFVHKMTDAAQKKRHLAMKRELEQNPQKRAELGLDGDLSELPADLTPEQFAALDDGEYFLRVWKALAARLRKEVTTISHCDCRPGNKLFCGGGGGLAPSAKHRPAQTPENDTHSMNVDANPANFIASFPDEDDDNAKQYSKDAATIVHLDWEACSMSPLMWDVGYMLTLQRPRRRFETTIVNVYLDALRDAIEQRLDRDGVTEPAKRAKVLSLCVPTREAAADLIKLMYIAQVYVCWALTEFGGCGERQGNSDDDMQSWDVCVKNAIRAATEDPSGMAALIGGGLSPIDIRLLRYRSARR